MGRQAIIRVKELTARYGDELILDRVTFDVEQGRKGPAATNVTVV